MPSQTLSAHDFSLTASRRPGVLQRLRLHAEPVLFTALMVLLVLGIARAAQPVPVAQQSAHPPGKPAAHTVADARLKAQPTPTASVH